MGGGVAHDEEAVGVFVGDDLDGMFAGELVCEIDELAIDLAYDGSLGEARANGLGEGEDGGTVGEFTGGVVGKFDNCHNSMQIYRAHAEAQRRREEEKSRRNQIRYIT